MRKWEELPADMQVPEVRRYYDILQRHKGSLILKRIFDIIAAGLLVILLSPVMLVLGILIKADSRGPVFFRQVRVTQYGKPVPGSSSSGPWSIMRISWEPRLLPREMPG